MPDLTLPIRAATETAAAYGLPHDRCDILQNGNTLVLRLSESLVARVVTDIGGPRRGGQWFEREIAVASHLANLGAPVIPTHPDLPPGPHQHLGFTLNFWQFVHSIPETPAPAAIGSTLHQCHKLLRSFDKPLPELAILHESLAVLDTLEPYRPFPEQTLRLLRHHLVSSLATLTSYPRQPLHGDAHPGNLMNTTLGLLWTDWEDTFLGPVEWDLASIIWNSRLLDADHETADSILDSYQTAGGAFDHGALDQCLIARAAVMSVWYPVLYPEPSPERLSKLSHRIAWLESL